MLSIHGLNEDDLMSFFTMTLLSDGVNNKMASLLEAKPQFTL